MSLNHCIFMALLSRFMDSIFNELDFDLLSCGIDCPRLKFQAVRE